MDLASYADLAVRLVNTGPGPSQADELTTPEAYRTLVADRPHLRGRVTGADLEALHSLRAELRLVFTSAARHDDAEVARHLNTLLARHPIHQQFTSHDGEPWHLHLVDSGSAADQFAAGAIAGLSGLVNTSGTAKVGVCAAAGCDRVLIAASPGQRDRYCSDACAPQASVRSLRMGSQGRGKGAASTAAS